MTAQGSPRARFRRALGAGNLLHALAAAHEAPSLALDDALGLLLLLAEKQDRLYVPAARRWLRRFAEERGPTLEQLADAADALAEIQHGLSEEASLVLRELMA